MQAQVERVQDGAHGRNRQIGLEVLVARPPERRHPVAGLHAQVGQRGGQPPRTGRARPRTVDQIDCDPAAAMTICLCPKSVSARRTIAGIVSGKSIIKSAHSGRTILQRVAVLGARDSRVSRCRKRSVWRSAGRP